MLVYMLYKNLNIMKTSKDILDQFGYDSGHSGASVVGALILGLAVGAIAGILFAPDRGVETRSNLSNTIHDLGSTVKDKAKQGIDKLNQLKDQAVDTVKSTTSGSQNQNADNPSYV